MIYVVLAMCLIFASYTDIMTHEVPLEIPFTLACTCLYKTLMYKADTGSILAFGIIFLVCMIGAMGGLGGADVLAASMSAFLIGLPMIMILITAFILSIVYNLVYNREKAEYPFIPFIAVPAICYLVRTYPVP